MIVSTEHLRAFWYVACLSKTLKRKPLVRTITELPMVLFRDPSGKAHALHDRCCHRNMPLSFGKLTPKGIQCKYHGWEFSPEGPCVRIPGQSPEAPVPPRACIPTFPVVEQDGLVWVYATAGAPPAQGPFKIAGDGNPDYGTLSVDFGLMQASIENAIDNFMDSLHPPFIHAGLIYDDAKRNRLDIELRPYKESGGHWGVEGLYLGEPPPMQGLIGRIFADRGVTTVIHEERYVVPSLTQADYRIADTSHLLSTHLFTPETPTQTRMYLVLRTKSRVPKPLTHVIVKSLFTTLFLQDIRALEHHQRALEKPGVLPRSSTELDLLSLSSVNVLSQLAEGKTEDQIQIKPQRYVAYI